MGLVDQINTQIATSQSYAGTAVTEASQAMEALIAAMANAETDFRVGYSTVGNPQADPMGSVPTADAWATTLATTLASIQGITWPGFPSLAELEKITKQVFEIPGDSPILSFAPAPGGLEVSLGDAPTITDVEMPPEPTFTDIPIPTLDDITIPDTPDFSDLPTFEVLPPTDLVAPAIPAFDYTEEEYLSGMHDAAEAWLLNVIYNGGTGLADDVEAGIFDRALTRETVTARRNLTNAIDEFAASGFPRPSGALRARTDAIRSELQNRTEDFSRKVAEDQANLAQKNSHFAITEGLRLEAMDMQLFNAVADRTLEAAKVFVEVAISQYNLLVTEYQARMDGYKAQASVFETLIRASMLEVEHYKAQLEAAKIEGQINSLLIEQYTATLQGQKLLADIYATRVNATKVQVENQSLYIDLFRSEIEAYKSQIQAKSLEFDAWKASLDAERTKLDVFEAEVAGVRSANEAKQAQIQGEAAAINATVDSNNGRLRAYEAELAGLLGQARLTTDGISAAASAQGAITNAYRGSVDYETAKTRVAIANAELAAASQRTNATEMNQFYQNESRLREKIQETLIAAATAANKVKAGQAAGAMASINTVSQLLGEEDQTAAT